MYTYTGSATPEEAQQHIRSVMQAGVRTFVCLQEEVPPQEKDALWPDDGMIPLADPKQVCVYVHLCVCVCLCMYACM